jgi:GDP-4-dehydro-6-deoxy-D-mannose reductase
VSEASRSTGVDLRDADATRERMRDVAPDVVYHLAALASVGRSWDQPARVLVDNAAISLNVLEAVRREAPSARVVVASSGEVYGPPERLPVDEAARLRPQSPYAVSKASADLLAGLYADAHGLAIVRARAFNHAGPGQGDAYALSSFARQAAAGATTIRTGRPDTRRDYTDVRDVVRAYRLLAACGEAGGVYNVCSETSTSAAELVELVAAAVGRELAVEVVPDRVRAHEVLEVRGSAARLQAATGWEREIPLARTARDAVVWWRDVDSAADRGRSSSAGQSA